MKRIRHGARETLSTGHAWAIITFALVILLLALLALGLSNRAASAREETPVDVLDPLSLAKYVDPLPVPAVAQPYAPNAYEIGAWSIVQKLHRDLPPTRVYGYGTSEATASYPGPTIVVRKGVPTTIRWTNHLPAGHLLEAAIDPTIPRAMTTTGVPIATHVHGAEVEPASDGGPHTWFTAGFAETGADWTKETLEYANDQLPATIWYHDHAFGYTRHNVYAGLAGFYLVTDPGNEPALPAAPYDLGLALQDRMFTPDGALWYPTEGVSEEHPVWVPEFFGEVMLVNGKAWPHLEVEPRVYRLRFLNGAQARFFSLSLNTRQGGSPGPAFHQIGTDGGYLAAPVVLNDPADARAPRLVLGPGERADVLVDFSGLPAGTEFILRNTAKTPFPNGEPPDPRTAGQLMLFRVVGDPVADPGTVPATLVPVEPLGSPDARRVMTLNELMNEEDEPVAALLNGMGFHHGGITELPVLGSTEQWEVVNLTADTHPIHLHLVQFQLVDRQKLHLQRYARAFAQANPQLPADDYVPVPVEPYLRGAPIPPDDNERGWKDTFRMNPGEVTRVRIRFAPQDGSAQYAFDATAEPGYVWHCHILEHEENDMMRPYRLVDPVAGGGAAGASLIPDFEAIAREASATASPAGSGIVAVMPQPLDAGSTVVFRLAAPSHVELDLYDVSGRHVRRLVGGTHGSGTTTVRAGDRLGAGVYLLRFRGGGVDETRKVVVAR